MSNIYLDRIQDGEFNQLVDNIQQFKKSKSEDGDKIFIRKHAFRSINIEEAILAFAIPYGEGETINDLLKKQVDILITLIPLGLSTKIKLLFLQINR